MTADYRVSEAVEDNEDLGGQRCLLYFFASLADMQKYSAYHLAWIGLDKSLSLIDSME